VVISEQLGLNTNLCLAVALGHDLGHCPDGHSGEEILSNLGGKPFKHYINGVVIAQHIERGGKGLNLTYETLDGILNHSRGAGELIIDNEKPLEYAVVMFADKIAYTFSDLNDAIRYGYLCEKNEKNTLLCLDVKEIPACAYDLGKNQRERTHNVIKSLINESKESDTVKFSESKEFEKFMELRKFMYEEIYPNINSTLHPVVWKELYKYFSNNALLVSLLTDEEANKFGYLLVKSKKIKKEDIKNFGVFEIIRDLERNNIDYNKIDYGDPDLHKEDFIY
jgi:dGTP triphosphohydrolase